MAGATTSTHSAVVRPNVAAQMGDAVFKNSDVLPIFRQVGPEPGATYDFITIVAGNSSAQVFTEDQAVPDAGYQQNIKVSAAWKTLRVFTRMTGHLRRELGAQWGGDQWPGAYTANFEKSKAIGDMVDLANTTFGGTKAIFSIAGIVDDDTTNFYNTSRSTYTALKSKVVAGGSAAVSLALMNSLIHQTYDAGFGGKIEALLVSPTQARKLSALVEGKLALPTRADVAGGAAGNMMPFAGAEIIEIRDMPATEIIGLSGLNSSWYFVNHETAPGGIDHLPYGVTADAQIDQYVMSGALICLDPSRQGKIEALGTT